MMYGYGGWGWGGWLFMALMMLVVWGAIVGGGILLVRSLWGGGNRATSNDALQVLDERFARGEIDAEEYTRRRQLLTSR